MTNMEVIAKFMEPCPRSHTRSRDSERGWWRLIGFDRKTADWRVRHDAFTLDRLHEVEARLSEAQAVTYVTLIGLHLKPWRWANFAWELVHATAEQKIRALAAVIRGEAERLAGKEPRPLNPTHPDSIILHGLGVTWDGPINAPKAEPPEIRRADATADQLAGVDDHAAVMLEAWALRQLLRANEDHARNAATAADFRRAAENWCLRAREQDRRANLWRVAAWIAAGVAFAMGAWRVVGVMAW